MNILVFGNPDYPQDNVAIEVSEKLSDIPSISFQYINPNSDLPVSENKCIYILDTVMGINTITLFTDKDIDKLVLSPRTTTHDYDLGFQLKYLSKIGRLKSVHIIGLPYKGKVDYVLVRSILRKLVAQDIQGS